MKKRLLAIFISMVLTLCLLVFALVGCDNTHGDDCDCQLCTKQQSGTEGLIYTLSKDGNSYEIYRYIGSAINVTVPNTYEGKPVTAIGLSAFARKPIARVTLPSSLTTISDWAFDSCEELTSIVIPEGVKSIGYRAFYYCTSLTSVVIPASVTDIAGGAFEYCESLTSIVLPNSVTRINERTFVGCISLSSVLMGSNVDRIDNHAFWACSSLTSFVVPDSVTVIGVNAFQNGHKLASVVIGSGVEIIGADAFANCPILTIYCKTSSEKPDWRTGWNSAERPVYWAGQWSMDANGNPVPNN